MTGTTRASSSPSPTGAAPGRVDSPPTSMIAAPWTTVLPAWRTAASWSNHSPPSENESGVTLRTPMMRQGRSTRRIVWASLLPSRSAGRGRSARRRHPLRQRAARLLGRAILAAREVVAHVGLHRTGERALAQPRSVVVEAVLEDEQARRGRRVVAQAIAVIEGLGRRRERAADDLDPALAQRELAERDVGPVRRAVAAA